jgi:hypothetical protein
VVEDEDRRITASGGRTAPVEIGQKWTDEVAAPLSAWPSPTVWHPVVGDVVVTDVALTEEDDGTFTVTGHAMPPPSVVHRVFLTATAFDVDDGTATIRLECSCGEILFDQGDEPGAVLLDDLLRLAHEHEKPNEGDDW